MRFKATRAEKRDHRRQVAVAPAISFWCTLQLESFSARKRLDDRSLHAQAAFADKTIGEELKQLEPVVYAKKKMRATFDQKKHQLAYLRRLHRNLANCAFFRL